MQGVVGGLVCAGAGLERGDCSDAIYDQYKPESMEDTVPRTVEGALLAIADKADTIGGMFGLGMEPTGSKDPFALRRAANGIVKILAESAVALPLTLSEVADRQLRIRRLLREGEGVSWRSGWSFICARRAGRLMTW